MDGLSDGYTVGILDLVHENDNSPFFEDAAPDFKRDLRPSQVAGVDAVEGIVGHQLITRF